TAHGRVYIWEGLTGKPIRSFSANSFPQQHADFLLAAAPDAKALVTGSNLEAGLRLWDPGTGAELGRLDLPKGEIPLSMAFAPGGKLLAVGQRSGKVDLWDMGKKEIVRSLSYPGPAYALAFALHQDHLAVSGAGQVVVFDLGNGGE